MNSKKYRQVMTKPKVISYYLNAHTSLKFNFNRSSIDITLKNKLPFIKYSSHKSTIHGSMQYADETQDKRGSTEHLHHN